jgi:tetratricopeptide (TPR) repeat protein
MGGQRKRGIPQKEFAMKKRFLAVLAALLLAFPLAGQEGSYRTASFDPNALAAARRTIPHTAAASLSDELQWLAVQIACLSMYNMAQTGDFVLEDPVDYYQPGAIRDYLTSLSGNETQNTMTYGICFNYAQLAYDDISRYRGYYEGLGMRPNGWYIASAFDNPNQIILFDPVSRDRASMTVNGVSVRENSRQNIRTHGGAKNHAWLWVYGKDGTIYWIDPTWTDNAGQVVWGIVRNGAEVQMRPRQELCIVPVSSNEASNEATNRGDASKNQGDWDRAIAEYTTALRDDPNNARAYYGRGNAFSNRKDYDTAIADYSQAIRLNPDYTYAYNGRGIAYRNKNDYDRAIADYTQAIRLDPNYGTAYHNRGVAYENKRDYDRAMADYTQAIRIEPNAGRYTGRGNAYRNKGDNDQAIADYTQAIRLDPNYTIAYNNRGIAYNAKGDRDRAIADYTQAIRLDPNYASAYNNRGIAYGGKGDNDRAIADYTQAIRLDPNYASAYIGRGNRYYAKKDYNRAIADYEAALRINPNNTLARDNLQLARRARGY